MRKGLLILLLGTALSAQVLVPGPQAAVFLSGVDDSDQPYGLYVPKSYDASKKYPLVISLHGAWSNHRVNLRRVFGKGNRPGESDAEATRYFPPLRDVDFIVASPFARGTMGYMGIAERDVYDVLADVKKRFSIDEDRIYLTGLSMGGGGTLWLALSRPDIWAAIAPVCPSIAQGTQELAGNALHLPVKLFHGDIDTAVPVDVSRTWHKLLLGLGVKAEYVEYPGVKHNSWDNAYKDGAIFDWFAQFRRNRFPDRVRFATRFYKYSSAYWVRIDGLTTGELATIDAKFTDKNRIEIDTAQVDGFTLQLAGHPMFEPGRPVSVKLDGAELAAEGTESVSFRSSRGVWQAGQYEQPTGGKRTGVEGPIREVVSGRHLYIYGTIDSPGREELEQRRTVSSFASDWQGPSARLALWLRSVADKEATDADLYGANLVLFGTKETNALIARYSTFFPLELNAGGADYGLVFVAPVGDRLVLVNSGLPWWTGADRAKRPGLRYLWSPYQVLLSFGDFILFKGSLENVVAEGNFTRSWKVPPEAAEKMEATGAVKVLR